MKKILITILLTLNIIGLLSPIAFAYAATGSWDLLQPVQIEGGDKNDYLKALPQGDKIDKQEDEQKSTATFYASATKFIMGLATILVVVGFFVAGVMYVTAQGNEEMTKKAVNIMMYTIVGVIIIAAAYGIIIGITKLKPF
ncbi:MAG: hypothetical protein UT33_C0021G0009 [Candidatus Peregrinibacteria bacterium GW2011_GWC2_39_14]|nr:MAG: hypothetical protein US92_C0013G0009 [Candidatus Peregrinibacteria bacterium GW2011_GWA2_38_36]KKR04373.1 MAG: hypothetical protein UT33_C0021G0009 [Candidatus Peregrinibacteria bacterium GW2011_GWC2_39_14]